MFNVSLASLVLLLSTETVQASTGSLSGVIEVDLLFPHNETCAPTEYMPLVFAFQNPEMAPLFGIDMRWTNFSSSNGSTYYRYLPVHVPGRMTEGSYELS
jgi:hypothetical protein